MATIFVGKNCTPTFVCLSTDIIGNALPGASLVGATIFCTDNSEWHIILPDLSLAEYVLPVNISLAGNVVIGKISVDQPLTDSIALSPYYAIQSVSSPGTAVALMSSATYVISVVIYPKTTNTSSIYIGTSAVDKTTSTQMIIAAGGTPISIDAPLGYKLNLNEWYVDAVTAGEGCFFIYLK
jgi:hypothetical protein